MSLQIWPVGHIPEISPGMDIGKVLKEGIQKTSLNIEPRDILTVTQKIISKAEGRIVQLKHVAPSSTAFAIARQSGKDPRLVEVILGETRRLLRVRGDILICETHHGFICANAGVDRSNVEGGEAVTLLPRYPDRSARRLAQDLGCGVIITDTFGRPWREGLLDVAIGLARVPPFVDLRGSRDTQGYPLQATNLAAVDALAAAAGLVMGKTSQTPAALIRGYIWESQESSIDSILRGKERDLFL
jgi:coenzyme F420-0:L-glutamate ligase / coenzyme F420-1:gamma-L-glutamate ligase